MKIPSNTEPLVSFQVDNTSTHGSNGRNLRLSKVPKSQRNTVNTTSFKNEDKTNQSSITNNNRYSVPMQGMRNSSLNSGNVTIGNESNRMNHLLTEGNNTSSIMTNDNDNKMKHKKKPNARHRLNKIKKDMSLENIDNKITQSMKQYQTNDKDSYNDDDNNSRLKQYVTLDDQRFIQRTFDLNKSYFSKSGFNGGNDDFKISFNKSDYSNPIQSLKILRRNKDIFSNIIDTYSQVQKDTFNKSIKEIEGLIMNTKISTTVKVMKMVPKADFIIPVIDKTDNTKKKTRPSILFVDDRPRLFSYYRYSSKNFPEGREQFTFTINGNKIILFGGISSIQKSNLLWELNIDTLEWSKIFPNNSSNTRFGHTTVCYQEKLYIFGGRSKMPNGSIMTGLDIYSFQENNWITPIIPSKSSAALRRNHIALIIAGQMIIHGGLNETGDCLNDCALLNFTPVKWMGCSIDSMTPGPYLYGHTACLVLPSHFRLNPKMALYKYPDNVGLTVLDMKLKEKGMYVFGGKTKTDVLSNDLWILKIGRRPLEWNKVDTKGKQPCPRAFHSMSYYETGNYLIVHGGRNDSISASFALNDTYIFDLETLEWIEVDLYSNLLDYKILTRCGHCSLIYSNKLIIFGGMNNNNYLGSSFLIVNLDFSFIPVGSKLQLKDNTKDKERSSNDNQEKDSKEGVKAPPMVKKQSNGSMFYMKNQLGVVKNLDLPPIK